MKFTERFSRQSLPRTASKSIIIIRLILPRVNMDFNLTNGISDQDYGSGKTTTSTGGTVKIRSDIGAQYPTPPSIGFQWDVFYLQHYIFPLFRIPWVARRFSF